MSIYFAIPVMALVATVQASIGARVQILGVHPDLCLIVALAMSLVFGPRQGLLWLVAGAIFQDLLSDGPFGVSLAAMVPLALFGAVSASRLFISAILLPPAIMAVGSLYYYGVAMLLMSLAGRNFDWLLMISSVILPATLVNTLLLPVCYAPIRVVRSWLTPASRTPVPLT